MPERCHSGKDRTTHSGYLKKSSKQQKRNGPPGHSVAGPSWGTNSGGGEAQRGQASSPPASSADMKGWQPPRTPTPQVEAAMLLTAAPHTSLYKNTKATTTEKDDDPKLEERPLQKPK